MTAWTAPVLGVPVRFEAETDGLLDAVRDAFGAWTDLPAVWVEDVPPFEVRLRSGPHEEMEAPPVRYDVGRPGRLHIAAGRSHAEADADARQASATVAPVWLNTPTALRTQWLEALTYALVTTVDRWPVHAAAFEYHDRLVVLAGASGAGKSSLAHAAARRGWTVRSEDVVFVSSRPTRRVWNPARREYRLDPDAATGLPERGHPVRTPNGKTRVLVDGGVAPVAPWEGPLSVVLLRRGTTGAAVPVSTETVRRALVGDLDPGFDLDPSAARRVARVLASHPGLRLDVSPGAEATLAVLVAALDTD